MVAAFGVECHQLFIGVAKHLGIARHVMRREPLGKGFPVLPRLGCAQHRINRFIEQVRLVDYVFGKAQNGCRVCRAGGRHEDFKLTPVHQLARIPLQRITQIDRDREGRRAAFGKSRG